ncbi:DUF433 domain-containing protein [Gloeocapsopsis dulcis]|uniref:DUF433 domain-containing protein n=1 Tax=Gloeocapsopsis dulcis AAB1 = 1H9 TaxID=1433147 RepID=A0A6N8FY16_9CHRO|nr:DUF433 domain-containing protein [Gloeocapsopsis dulcis]MUL38030.1 hypothetical protein [Gloeocapsopsis dulcis AAB1 = 1H9]WNN91489.1 DUF433 domain-containing protein [Gloeocapsopsis dulcis]
MALAIVLEPAPIETDAHGVVRVAKTRVTLDTVVTAFLEGCTSEEIGEQYPLVRNAEVDGANRPIPRVLLPTQNQPSRR